MKINLEHIKNSLLRAVLLISNSMNEEYTDLNNVYRYSICCIYRILSVIFAEKSGLLPNTIHKQIKYTRSADEPGLFQNSLNLQSDLLGIKNKVFSEYDMEIKIKEEYFLEFLGIFKAIISLKTIDVDFFGNLYEYFQEYKLAEYNSHTQSQQLKLDLKPEYKYTLIKQFPKKHYGSLLAEKEFVDRLINSSLDKILSKTSSLRDLLNLKILDPSCRGGRSLLNIYLKIYSKAHSELNKGISDNDIKRLILANCIYGIDSDNFACDITKLVLFLVANRTEHFKNIICEDFQGENFPQTSEFSLVIGISPSGQAAVSRYYDLYSDFIKKGLESLVKDNGMLACIIPDKYLTSSCARKLRQLILQNHSIKEIITFKNKKISKVYDILPAILLLQKGQKGNRDVKVIEISNNIEEISVVNQDFYNKSYNLSFRTSWNANKQEIIELIQAKSFPLNEICYINRGVQPGSKRKFIFNNPNAVITEDKKYLKHFIKAGNIKKYNILYSGSHILYIQDGEEKLDNPAFPELFSSKKIVIADLSGSKKINAALDNNKYVTNYSTINCIHKKELLNLNQSFPNLKSLKILDSKEPEITAYKWLNEEYVYTRKVTVYRNTKFNNIELNYALSLINSRLMDFYFNNYLYGNHSIITELIKNIPVYDLDAADLSTNLTYDNNTNAKNIFFHAVNDGDFSSIYHFLNYAVQKMAEYKQNLDDLEFNILDDMVNKAVYRLYGFNDNQIKIIEGSY